MHRFVLREDLHIRSRLSNSSSAMALGLLQILVIKKNIYDCSIILSVVYMYCSLDTKLRRHECTSIR
uniref:Uncharacterized protein n=1 Tax=Brassica oleracea var. oleracea TaxID=109376 RepID=A0A0D3AQD4_BRAOL